MNSSAAPLKTNCMYFQAGASYKKGLQDTVLPCHKASTPPTRSQRRQALTTLHFLPSNSSNAGAFGEVFWEGLALQAGLGAVKGLGPLLTGPPWFFSAGFLWVFMSSETCLKPAREVKHEIQLSSKNAVSQTLDVSDYNNQHDNIFQNANGLLRLGLS